MKYISDKYQVLYIKINSVYKDFAIQVLKRNYICNNHIKFNHIYNITKKDKDRN